MQDDKKVLIINSLAKAKEALLNAQANIDIDMLAGAQNRIYYAIFYSVLALGYLEGFVTSKHSQLMGWFNKKFIHEDKVFEEEMFDIYKTTYKNRMIFDYTVTENPNREDVVSNFAEARIFVDKIENYVKSKY